MREKKKKKNAYRTRGRITLAHAREIFDAVSAVINNAGSRRRAARKNSGPLGVGGGRNDPPPHGRGGYIRPAAKLAAAAAAETAADSTDADVCATVRCKRCLTVHPVARLRTAAAAAASNVLAPISKPCIGFASANETHVANLRSQSTALRDRSFSFGSVSQSNDEGLELGWDGNRSRFLTFPSIFPLSSTILEAARLLSKNETS